MQTMLTCKGFIERERKLVREETGLWVQEWQKRRERQRERKTNKQAKRQRHRERETGR